MTQVVTIVHEIIRDFIACTWKIWVLADISIPVNISHADLMWEFIHMQRQRLGQQHIRMLNKTPLHTYSWNEGDEQYNVYRQR